MVLGEISRTQKLLTQRWLVAVIAPVALLLFVGLILAFQIVKLTDAAHWVDHTDEVMGRVSEIQNQVVDQETGIRGYLLSGDRAFLGPYERAQPLPMFAAVHALVADNASQQVRLDLARARYEAYLRPAAGGFAVKRDAYFRDQFRRVLATGERPKLGVDMWQVLGEVRCPTLVVRGTKSDMFAAETVEKMRGANPRIELVEVEAGHNIPGENPAALAAAIRSFLTQLEQ